MVEYVAGDGIAESGLVLWITGLSGAGKTTLAREVVDLLRQQGRPALLLDGDELRAALSFGHQESKGHGYSRKDRLANAKRYSRLARLFSRQGFTVVVATISLFREVHGWNRLNLPGYFEVYLRVPIAELRRRDPEGLYREFNRGQLDNLVGMDLEIDEPANPDWLVEFGQGCGPPNYLAKELVERFDRKWEVRNGK